MSGRILPGSQETWSGGEVSPLAECVLAPNPSPWTLDGTNTWIVGEPGGSCVVIDPGPITNGHGQAIEDTLDRRKGSPVSVLLTHGHVDHAEGAGELALRLGVPLRAWDADILPDPVEAFGSHHHGEKIEVEGGILEVLATPGHSSDSVCFVIGSMILTGDTVLGRGTTLVAHPDGRLDDYLVSLDLLARVCDERGVGLLLPGHGPTVDDPRSVVSTYISHRHERLDEISAAMAAGAQTADEIVDRVYVDIPREVRPAALATVLAQIEYLEGN